MRPEIVHLRLGLEALCRKLGRRLGVLGPWSLRAQAWILRVWAALAALLLVMFSGHGPAETTLVTAVCGYYTLCEAHAYLESIAGPPPADLDSMEMWVTQPI